MSEGAALLKKSGVVVVSAAFIIIGAIFVLSYDSAYVSSSTLAESTGLSHSSEQLMELFDVSADSSDTARVVPRSQDTASSQSSTTTGGGAAAVGSSPLLEEGESVVIHIGGNTDKKPTPSPPAPQAAVVTTTSTIRTTTATTTTTTTSSQEDTRSTIIMVITRRDAFERRQAIRETWANGYKNVFFFVGNRDCELPMQYRVEWECIPSGAQVPANVQAEYDARIKSVEKQLAEEAKQHGDIALLDMVDVYRKLPKKMKLGYKWALERFPKAQWFVKVDDDSVARIAQLEADFAQYAPKLSVVGCIWRHLSVPRSGKWAELNYKPYMYPPFPGGSCGHAISRDVAKYITELDGFEYQGEDVSLGIWLDESPLKSQIKWITSPRFANSGNCFDTSKFVMGHDIESQKMRECFASVRAASGGARTPLQANGAAQGTRFVGIDLVGGLGNRLFQTASALGIAKREGVEMCFMGGETLLLDLFVGPFPGRCTRRPVRHQEERGYGIFQDFSVVPGGTQVGMYLQSHLYFDKIAPEVQAMYNFRPLYVEKVKQRLEPLRARASHIVGIHVRRGDHIALGYLNFPPNSYFQNAMAFFKQLYPNPHFVVLSNEVQWCKSQGVFQAADVTIFDTPSSSSETDFATLASADGMIISIGTYGWWAGWLAHARSKAPVVYYADEINLAHHINAGKIDPKHFYLPTWTAMGA